LSGWFICAHKLRVKVQIRYPTMFTRRRPMLDPVRLSYAFIRDWKKIRVITRARTRQRASRIMKERASSLRRGRDRTRRERPLHRLSRGNRRTRVEIADAHVPSVRVTRVRRRVSHPRVRDTYEVRIACVRRACGNTNIVSAVSRGD